MSVILQLTPHDPLIARDGRPFGAGQGNRMRGLPWPLPSVVAGSFRTALVKACSGDFSGDIPQRLMQIAVAGVFPVHGGELYLPSPNDYVWNEETGARYRASPYDLSNCCDFPKDMPLQPVMLPDGVTDFKPADSPAWWPVGKYAEWLLGNEVCFDSSFLRSPLQETRDHVCLDAERGAAAEGQIFATAGLNVTRLPRFGVDGSRPWHERLAEITLSGRITIPDSETELKIDPKFDIWHPLGGERRLVHWKQTESKLWECPPAIREELKTATKVTKVRMVLATPAIFNHGWKPDLTNGPLKDVGLKLVGASNGRWKAVSGWSLAPPRGPKAIRRMVPAGSVYFFTCEKGVAAKLAEVWLKPVSDDEQAQRDGFGLALWGTW